MKLLCTGSRITRLALAIGVACTVLVTTIDVIPATTASAAPNVAATPGPNGVATPQARRSQRLERLLKRERNVLTREQNQLTKAGELATKIENYIDNQKSNGKDTSALEAALANFNTAITTAQSHYNTAKSTLDANAGFDANGDVADISQARSTVQTAGKAELLFHLTVRQAAIDLRTAVREYRVVNHPTAQGSKQD